MINLLKIAYNRSRAEDAQRMGDSRTIRTKSNISNCSRCLVFLLAKKAIVSSSDTREWVEINVKAREHEISLSVWWPLLQYRNWFKNIFLCFISNVAIFLLRLFPLASDIRRRPACCDWLCAHTASIKYDGKQSDVDGVSVGKIYSALKHIDFLFCMMNAWALRLSGSERKMEIHEKQFQHFHINIISFRICNFVTFYKLEKETREKIG